MAARATWSATADLAPHRPLADQSRCAATRPSGAVACAGRRIMPVQVTQDAEFGPVVDLLVKLVKHESCLVLLGVRASDGSQWLPPRSGRQLPEHVLPESVRTVQDGNSLRGGGRRRVIPFKAAGRPLHSKPLRVPFPPVASDEVPQPPGDRCERRVTGTSVGTQDSYRPVRVISPIGPGAGPADRPAAGHRLPEVFVVGEP